MRTTISTYLESLSLGEKRDFPLAWRLQTVNFRESASEDPPPGWGETGYGSTRHGEPVFAPFTVDGRTSVVVSLHYESRQDSPPARYPCTVWHKEYAMVKEDGRWLIDGIWTDTFYEEQIAC